MNEETPRPDLGVEKPTSEKKPISEVETVQRETRPLVSKSKEESERLAQLQLKLQSLPKVDIQGQNSLQFQQSTQEHPKGFWHSPLKVARNSLLYPTWETETMVALGSLTSIPLSVAIAALGAPGVGVAGYLAALGLTGFELVRNRMMERKVSNFFRVMKVMPGKEKFLKDGTRVTLDDFVGELHMSGLTRLWRLAFMKDKVKRALIVTEGVLEGLVNVGEKVRGGDPWYSDFKAFKGTSWIVNPRIAERFGFEVSEPEGGRFFTIFLRKVDKAISFVPQMAPMAEIHTAWISRAKLMEVYDSGIIQDELAKLRRGLIRRT